MYPFEYVDFTETLLFSVEYIQTIVSVNVTIVALLLVRALRRPKTLSSAAAYSHVFLGMVFLPTLYSLGIYSTYAASHSDAASRGYDLSKPSLREALERYVEEGAGAGRPSLEEVLEGGNYAPVFTTRYELPYLIKDLFRMSMVHSDEHNEENIDEGYNKGNDWFSATLGAPMVYTSGIYRTGNESLWEAQQYKLDYVANALDLNKGDKVLDIGCGWGRLVQHFTDKYGAKVTGVTLSSEQLKFGRELNKHNDGEILLQDAMKMHERAGLVPEGGFNKITSLEMAEHVGIRRYQQFLTKVHDMLADDGVFYFQVAGLRRHWRFEDLVWGLFMGEHVFPGADASCPAGWVTTQLERAGFEVQRVSNLGSHYSRTLAQWLENWRASEAQMVGKYGITAYRRWEVFLAWSTRIARIGSSTVFMVTATKQGGTKTMTDHVAARREYRRVATQQSLAPKW